MHTPDWLLSFGRNINSRDGEDGIIEKIFGIIGTKNRWCVELGALTGVYGSNTRHLIVDKGWSSVQIEADPIYYKELEEGFSAYKNVTCVNSFVSFEGNDALDSILSRTKISKDLDLLVLDIDGNDYHVWESLSVYRPRVFIVEFNPTIPHEVAFVQPKDMSVNQGSSLRSIAELGKEKGYELVAANSDNAFFVLKELFPKFDMDNSSLDEIHTDRSLVTYFFQLYDGTVKIAGNTKLRWHNIPIREKHIQVLSRYRRRFPNHIDPSERVRRLKEKVRKLPFYAFMQRVRTGVRKLLS